MLAKVLFLTLVVLMAVTCAMQDEPEPSVAATLDATVDAWFTHNGAIPTPCLVIAYDVRPQALNLGEVNAICGVAPPGERTEGCFLRPITLGAPPFIFYTSTWYLPHEYTHLLAWCVDGDPDGQHLNPTYWDEIVPSALETLRQ